MNNFEIGKVLGKGSFGSVCIVTRKQDKKIYAMKRFNLHSPKNEIESALNEIRLLYSLNHPNIIGYKDAFYDSPSYTLNIVMEYADGGDLSKLIENNKKKHLNFQEKVIWEWIFQLLNGLLYLHTNHIMHRDLKSANIFLMKNGLLKIGDLNVSKLSKNNYARTKTGTPYYLAPEVWEDKPYDYKCDIWSLGCIIYELCTLSPPFRGKNFKELFNYVKNGYYKPIPKYYSNDLSEIIGMMLKTHPNDRISAKELLDCNIIKNKISKKEIIPKKESNFIGTIKIPRNIKDINRVLPHERYQMGENDPYETMKKTIKLMQNNNNNNNNKQNSNQKINIKPLNNYDRELANLIKNKNFQNDNHQKPIIIPNEQKNNREYNIFNQNKNEINNNHHLNKNNIINDKKININDNNKNRFVNNFEVKKNISKKEENGINTKQRKEQDQFALIKQQFVNQPNRGNKKMQFNQQKVNDMKNRRPPSGQPRNKYIGNKINDNNQINRNKINLNSKNKRPNSQYQNRIKVNNNNAPKYNNNGIIRKYEIKNHMIEHNGEVFDMNPYKRKNKANYNQINVKEYKENNKMKFNKYLYNGGRVKYNDNEYKKYAINERLRKNPSKHNNRINRDGKYKK